MIMKESPRIDVPLVAVGCDFRTANVAFREKLVTTPEQRRELHEGILAADRTAGFAALETCNRVEWIVSTEQPEWIAELLKAQILQRWQQSMPNVSSHPEPLVYVGREASWHLLRVVSGLESLAAGEAQIAGQFQDALLRSREEKTTSPILNRLASHAGRLAKTGVRIGYRSDYRRGIHGMTVDYLKQMFNGEVRDKVIVVVGMGAIGRRTAEVAEQELSRNVIRVNRTVGSQHAAHWRQLADLPQISAAADAAVIATGALEPVLDEQAFTPGKRDRPLLVMDIGIPAQVAPAARELSHLDYRNLDDLIALDPGGDAHQALAKPMEQEVRQEAAMFKRFCIERSIVTLLEETQQRRQQFMLEQIPSIVEQELQGLDPDQRRLVEASMKQLISDFSNDSFQSIHNLLEQKWSEL